MSATQGKTREELKRLHELDQMKRKLAQDEYDKKLLQEASLARGQERIQELLNNPFELLKGISKAIRPDSSEATNFGQFFLMLFSTLIDLCVAAHDAQKNNPTNHQTNNAASMGPVPNVPNVLNQFSNFINQFTKACANPHSDRTPTTGSRPTL